MSRPATVLDGPNLDLLGKRHPPICGYETLTDADQAALEQIAACSTRRA